MTKSGAIAYLIDAVYIPRASTLQLPLVVKNLLIPIALAILLAWLLWKIANLQRACQQSPQAAMAYADDYS
ncbi:MULTISPECIES: hypothetical protein [Thermoleptolyngbya]|uniref:hypothetical protein n=1 Tax=Thermoleptolyngbya TaxID=2303528 RepID=UPI0019650E09|nr:MULTISPECIES: hypothetical protein [Thermoleptolyngbya]